MTVFIEDVVEDLEIKANIDFMKFPENFLFEATPPVKTVLSVVLRNLKSVQLSYFIVKNFDDQSKIVFDVKDTEIFAVEKFKFAGIDNLVFANSCRSALGEVPCEDVFKFKELGPDIAMVVMMGMIMGLTGMLCDVRLE